MHRFLFEVWWTFDEITFSIHIEFSEQETLQKLNISIDSEEIAYIEQSNMHSTDTKSFQNMEFSTSIGLNANVAYNSIQCLLLCIDNQISFNDSLCCVASKLSLYLSLSLTSIPTILLSVALSYHSVDNVMNNAKPYENGNEEYSNTYEKPLKYIYSFVRRSPFCAAIKCDWVYGILTCKTLWFSMRFAKSH